MSSPNLKQFDQSGATSGQGVRWSGSTWAATDLPSGHSTVGTGWFGDGSDGDVTISTSVTLTNDRYYNNLTVTSTGSLFTAGFRVYVKETATVDAGGVIHNDGPTATLQAGAVATASAVVNNGANGGAGGSAANGTAGSAKSFSLGGQGGSGGGATGPTRNGGGAGAHNQPTSFVLLTSGRVEDVTMVGGGSGGGGGGANGVGGGGGAGGGVLILVAKNLVNNGTIRALGGNGAPGQSTNSGGGGGGGGVVLGYRTLSGSGTISAAGGAGGASGGGTGVAGNAGNVGQIRQMVLT